MTGSIAREVSAWATGILVTSLALAGVGTGAVLHVQQVRALDRALLTAVHGHLHPEEDSRWEAEHSRSPIEAWVVQPGDPSLPQGIVHAMDDDEGPVFVDHGATRLVLLPVEVEGPGDRERHELVAAAAPRVTVARSLGPFAVVYAGLSLGIAVFASLLLSRRVRTAFAPIDRARSEAAQVAGLGRGLRLTETAPEEIRSLLHAINELLDRLDVAWAAQGRFTAEAAHELRTPVTSLLGELEVALRREPSAADRDVLDSAREEAVRLARIVDALSTLARLDAGEAERGRELVRARELAEAALEAERTALEGAGCTITLEIRADPELEVSAPLVELALANLLRNAARHAPGSTVALRVAIDDGEATFEVEDGGPGVPPGDREALFDRFARAPDARDRDQEGLGLGLPLAREVARRHGGDCVLEASPSGGTLARLTLGAAVLSRV